MIAGALPRLRRLWPDGAWPTFSPDGETIAFAGNLRQGKRRVFILPAAAGGGVEPEPLTPEDLDATRPVWSRGANALVFNVDNRHLFRIEADGGRCCPFLPPSGPLRLVHPCWYPDARTVVAVGYRDGAAGREAALYRVDPEAPQPLSPLTRFPDVCAGRPSVAPGGEAVVFAGNAGGCDQERNQLWIVEPPRPARRLEPGEPSGAVHGRGPGWSPDGRWIAFASARPAENPTKATPKAAWVIAAGGGEAHRLSDAACNPAQVTWSPDQTRIAIGSFHHGISVIEVPRSYQPRRPLAGAARP